MAFVPHSLRVVLCVVPLMMIAAPAGATNYYVAPTGSDSASGLTGAPWKTINHAAGAIAAGDTVHVAPGTYAEAVTSAISGTGAAHVTFVSDTRWGAKLQSTAFNAWLNSGSYVDIVGFDISGTGCLGIFNTGSYARMIGNHVHDVKADTCGTNGGAGIDNGNFTAHDSDIIGNVVHDIGTGASSSRVHGIYHSNLRGHIWNNIVYRNVGWGIHTWHAPVDLVIANNLIFENLHGGIIVGAGDLPGGVVADGFVVANNIVINNYNIAGIIEYGTTGTHNAYRNNLVYGNPVGAFALQNGNTPSGTLTVDPKLVKYLADGSGDYHLSALSPCVNAGVTQGAPSDDFAGIARPQGGAMDIGPFEWTAASLDGGGMPMDPSTTADAGPAADGGTSADPGLAADGGTAADPGAASGGGGGGGGGDGCAVGGQPGTGGPSSGLILELGLVALIALRPRRRRT